MTFAIVDGGIEDYLRRLYDDGDPVRIPEHRMTVSQAELARRLVQPGG